MTVAESRARLTWLDTLKGIGIVFVVLGHQGEGFLKLHIYSFHLPLFFFVSGYLLDPSKYDGFKPFLKRRIATRVVPYVFFYALSSLLLALTYLGDTYRQSIDAGLRMGVLLNVNGAASLVNDQISGLLYANGDWLGRVNNVALWFLPCLFVAEMLFFFLQRTVGGNAGKLALVLFLVSIVGYAESRWAIARLPWSIDSAMTAVVFYGGGFLFKELQQRGSLPRELGTRNRVVLGVAAAIVCCGAGVLNGRVDMNANAYGNYFYFYLAAFSGILLYALLAARLAAATFLAYFGRNAIILLWLHLHAVLLAVVALDRFVELFTKDMIVINNLAYDVLITLLVMAISVPVIQAMNRFFPFVSGRQRTA